MGFFKSSARTVTGLLSRIGRLSFSPAWLVLIGIVTVFNVVFLSVVTYKNEFILSEPLVISSFLAKILFDIALVCLVTMLLKVLIRVNWAVTAFLTFYFFLSLANIVFYHFGNTMVERHHFALIEPYSIMVYIPLWGLLLVLFSVITAFVLFRQLVSRLNVQSPILRSLCYIVVMVALVAFNKTGAFTKRDDDRFDRVIRGFHDAQIYYASRNQLLSLVKDVTFPALGERLKALSPVTEEFVDDYNLSSSRFKLEKDLSEYRSIIEDWGIPLGTDLPPVPSGAGKSYSRIILVLTESLTLEALPCYNPQLETIFADRFFCRPDIIKSTFTNLYTSGAPTLQGLTVLFNGHPNYTVHEPTGHRNSFPALLEKAGFKSVFMRSASKYFANENLVFRSMGFSEIIGREDFYDDPELRRYIYGWGLEDRILYEQALDYIDGRRDEKLFISIFGTDTHPPHGQVHFKHLKYPSRPGFKKAVGKESWQWLKAVDHMDYDIDGFIRGLEEKGLFDQDTLIVVASDHSSPINNVTRRIPGHPRTNLARIPVIFLSKRPLPSLSEGDRAKLASEVDIAPTIFHLLGLKRPQGWWGQSLFDPGRRPYAVGLDKGFASYKNLENDLLINVDKPSNNREKDFLKLFYTVFTGDGR